MAHTLAAAPGTVHHDVAFCKWDRLWVSSQGGLAAEQLPGPSEGHTTGKVLSSFLKDISSV